MAITFRNVFATFEAREVEAITGATKETQRALRYRGFFDRAGQRRAAHDLHDLARWIVIRALAERGIGPSKSAEVAQSAALRIEYFALSHPGAIEDKTGGEFERGLKLRKIPPARCFVHWTNNPTDPTKYLVVADDGFMHFVNDLNEASFSVFAILLDLEALGMMIAERAGRPLVTVEIEQPARARIPAQEEKTQ